MKFSVLMSVYFKEDPDHFRMALESNLTAQTRKPNELVLVCDGPLTQALDAVIEQYTEKFPDILKVCRLLENRGLGEALNYGLTQCRYDWIARADSDDVCDNRRFEIQTMYLSEHPDVDILGGCIDEFETDWQKPLRIKTMPITHEEMIKAARRRNPLNHMTVMFRKSVVEAAGSYQHLPYMEDYFLWIRAMKNGARFANLDSILVHARIGNGMERRRGDRVLITSRKKLNQYMLDHGMTGRLDAFVSNAAIAGITLCPNWVRRFIYDKLLRK